MMMITPLGIDLGIDTRQHTLVAGAIMVTGRRNHWSCRMDGDCGEEGNDENNKLHKFFWKGSRFRPIWPMIAVNIPSLQSGDFDLLIDRSDKSDLSVPTNQILCNDLLHHSCAVAMTFCLHANTMEQGQPGIT